MCPAKGFRLSPFGKSVWGSITGTLSNQTDLQTALDGKVPYTGATADVDLTGYGLLVDNIVFPALGSFIFDESGATETVIAQMGDGQIGISNSATVYGILDMSGLTTADKTFVFPDLSGTIVTTAGAGADMDLGEYNLTVGGNITFSGIGEGIVLVDGSGVLQGSTALTLTHLEIQNSVSGFAAIFDPSLLGTEDRTFTFPDASGTLALTSDFGVLETDPVFTAWDKSTGISITESQISDLQSYLLQDSISDDAYGAGWDADTTHAPSKNAVYDKIETLGGGHNPVTLAADADAILGLNVQELNLDNQNANTVFAGPVAAPAADPTFRALVAADIPDLSAVYAVVADAYSDEKVDDRVAALLQEGAGIDLTYDDNANTLTIASTITQYTDEMVDDRVAALLVAGNNIDLTYNDVANTLTIDVETLTLADISDITASAAEVNVLDGIPGTLTATELGYVDGVTSAIQTQLNGKLANIVEDTTPQLGGDLDANAHAIVAADHGAAATDQVINVCYGTGDPPVANTTTEGTLFVKYTA